MREERECWVANFERGSKVVGDGKELLGNEGERFKVVALDEESEHCFPAFIG